MSDQACYLIRYRDPKDGKIQDLMAQKIEDSSLGLGFVAISEFIFDTNSILANPKEEAKKKSFENTKTFHLSIYSILSVVELGDHPNKLSFKNDKSNLLVLKTDASETSLN